MTNPELECILFTTMAERKETYKISKIFALLKVLDKDKRYDPEAYSFVMTSLHYTTKKLKRKGHVTGQELLDGIKEYALEQFGPMARSVLEYWGVKTTGDFGEIVFNMINAGVLGKNDKDSKRDFINRYDFKRVFDNDFKYTIH